MCQTNRNLQCVRMERRLCAKQTGTYGVYGWTIPRHYVPRGGMKFSSSDVRKPRNCLQCPSAMSLVNTFKSNLCISVG